MGEGESEGGSEGGGRGEGGEGEGRLIVYGRSHGVRNYEGKIPGSQIVER